MRQGVIFGDSIESFFDLIFYFGNKRCSVYNIFVLRVQFFFDDFFYSFFDMLKYSILFLLMYMIIWCFKEYLVEMFRFFSMVEYFKSEMNQIFDKE